LNSPLHFYRPEGLDDVAISVLHRDRHFKFQTDTNERTWSGGDSEPRPVNVNVQFGGPIWGGSADGKMFNLPDMPGYFLRGVDNTNSGLQGRDPDRLNHTSFPGGSTLGVGSKQDYRTSRNGFDLTNATVPT